LRKLTRVALLVELLHICGPGNRQINTAISAKKKVPKSTLTRETFGEGLHDAGAAAAVLPEDLLWGVHVRVDG
jgi:hypothetical protein